MVKKTLANASDSECAAWKFFKSDSVDPKKVDPPADDEKSNSEKEPHVSAQNIVRGNLCKGVFYYAGTDKPPLRAEYYAWNAWNYLGSSAPADRKEIYEKNTLKCYKFYDSEFKPNFYQKFMRKKIDKNNVASQQGTANIEAQAYINRVNSLSKNDKGNVGQALPYKWQAHHILPMTCFMKVFEPDDLIIIRSSNYDINAGDNIIFLPARKKLTRYHELPYHSSNHLNYNDEIIEDFKEVKKNIEKKKKKGQPHENIAIDIEKMLHIIEKKKYKHIASFGQARLD